jgi:hypothetical protein
MKFLDTHKVPKPMETLFKPKDISARRRELRQKIRHCKVEAKNKALSKEEQRKFRNNALVLLRELQQLPTKAEETL